MKLSKYYTQTVTVTYSNTLCPECPGGCDLRTYKYRHDCTELRKTFVFAYKIVPKHVK